MRGTVAEMNALCFIRSTIYGQLYIFYVPNSLKELQLKTTRNVHEKVVTVFM